MNSANKNHIVKVGLPYYYEHAPKDIWVVFSIFWVFICTQIRWFVRVHRVVGVCHKYHATSMTHKAVHLIRCICACVARIYAALRYDDSTSRVMLLPNGMRSLTLHLPSNIYPISYTIHSTLRVRNTQRVHNMLPSVHGTRRKMRRWCSCPKWLLEYDYFVLTTLVPPSASFGTWNGYFKVTYGVVSLVQLVCCGRCVRPLEKHNKFQ